MQSDGDHGHGGIGRSRFELNDRSSAGLLALALFLSFPFVLLGMEAFVLRDFAGFGYPLAAHLKQSLLSGEIPHWNPLNNCGLPFLAQWNTMVCYPGSLLLFLGPLSFSLNLFCLLHLLLGGIGMYRLTSKWIESPAAGLVGGSAYMFNGLLLNSLMWPNNIAAFGWLPWVMLTATNGAKQGRRATIIAVLVGSMQMLTGAPEVILFTWIMIALLEIVSVFPKTEESCASQITRRAIRFAGIVGGIALLCAIQLLPFYELLTLSQRGGADYDDNWAASKWVWVNLIVPLFRTQWTPDKTLFLENQAWTHSFYPGVAVWLLAVLAVFNQRERRVRLLGVLVLVAVVCSVGRKGLLFSVVESLAPIGFMRFPVKMLIVCSVALPILAAYGFQSVLRSEEKGSRATFLWALGLIAMWLTVAGALIAKGPLAPDPSTIWSNLGGRFAFLIAAALVLWKFQTGAVPAVPALMLAGLVIMDGNLHHPSLTPGIPRAFWTEPLPELEFEQQTRPGRSRAAITVGVQNLFHHHTAPDMGPGLIGKRLAMQANLNLPRGIPKVNGFYSLYFPQMHDIEDQLYTGPASFNTNIADALSISQTLIYTGELRWHERPSALPWVSIGQAPRFLPANQVLEFVASPAFRPQEMVCLSDQNRERIEADQDDSATVTNLIFGNHQITFETLTRKPTMVVLSQNMHPSWRATVDGKITPIVRANHAFQAIVVPAGAHQIELRFTADYFRLGLWISAGTLLVLAILWGFRWRTRS